MDNMDSSAGAGGGNAREQVSTPAILLMVVGGISVLAALWGVVQALTGANQAAMEQMLNNPQLPEGAKSILAATSKGGIFSSIFQLGLGGVTLFGGLKMKNLESYGLAMAASIIAIIPCFGSCCCIGIPIGIWSLIILNKPEVKAAFPRS
ncbi:hypothetical protein [Hyalangium versicolor]|uniref:hypothetical protein n=1 Tax=Hyalangium versicolor TaxID=2861190 RepID=UPI001CCB0FA1|nr:hypothetical protein [Hyalangium versicolor]